MIAGLSFFEKDPIEWREHPIGDLYKELFSLMKENTALWHSEWGTTMIHVPNSAEESVLSFVRQNETDKVFAVINFSGEKQTVQFEESLHHGRYTEYFSGETVRFESDSIIEIDPWDYVVYVK